MLLSCSTASKGRKEMPKSEFRRDIGVSRFFDGLDLVEPGVVRVPQWRPGSELHAAIPTIMWGGVGRKP